MRIGVFGGTFDPPHVGHLIVAQDALIRLGLEHVVFVPAAVPPHKKDRSVTPSAIRLAMLTEALAGDSRFRLDPLELERGGPSYTVDTLRAYRRDHPEAALHLLLGADQYREFSSWRHPDEIRRLARLAVLSRGGDTHPGWAADDIEIVEVTRIDLSATDIRSRIAAGQPIRYLVPEAVERVIQAHGLYEGTPAAVAPLEGNA